MDRSRRKPWFGRAPTPWPARPHLDRLTIATRIGRALFALLLLGALHRVAMEGF